jgi:ketosteroid isomerase-like protein
MSSPNDPMAAVLEYVDAFNDGDVKRMAATCADPMQILDGMSPHVWQGPTAAEDWWRAVLTEGEHLGTSRYHITLGDPSHVDVTGDYAYVVAPATMTFDQPPSPTTK